MPPKRAANANFGVVLPPLEGCVVAISGTFPGTTQAAVKELVAQSGGKVSSSVTAATTHLVTTKPDFDKPSAKVSSSRVLGIHIVSLQWLQECQDSSTRKPESEYGLDRDADDGSSSDEDQPPVLVAVIKPANSSAKRIAAPASTAGSSSDGKPARKKAKTTNGTQAATQTATKPVPAKSVPAKSAPAKPATASSQATKPATTSSPPAKPGAASSQMAKSHNLRVPVDECCTLNAYAVYIDDDSVIWDASLNQSNSANNNNKFYRIQLLHSNRSHFKTWTRWGRVGDRGQSALIGDGSLDDAVNRFCVKFKDKTGRRWEDRTDDPVPGKYAFIERSYEPDSSIDDDDWGGADEADGDGDDWKPPMCTLAEPVQKLVQLIFNQQYFAATMTELKYDANKLPLGKLSKTTISRGFQALKDLAALFDDSTLASTAYHTTLGSAVESLSNIYYTFIPHAFGRARPPVIRDYVALKKEIELLESLSDMKDAELIMKTDRARTDTMHPLDKQYRGLGMKEMAPLDPDSAEYTELVDYLVGTRGATHLATNYTVEAIFRIEREGEHKRFCDSTFAGPPQDRRLLWHGSRATNYGGILSQGLRIAPPEAPVSGYMFGKGIYLADMSSKSANYCYSNMSGNTGLLLLCEAELGDPMQELVYASYSAAEHAEAMGAFSTWGRGQTGPKAWKDAACVHPELAGVKMPDVSTSPGPTGIPDAVLLYNEYIAYNTAQIRLRYLFQVKMA